MTMKSLYICEDILLLITCTSIINYSLNIQLQSCNVWVYEPQSKRKFGGQ